MLLSSQISNSTDCLADSSDSFDSPASLPRETSKKRKRTLEEVTAAITSLKDLKYEPLVLNKQAPQLNLPSGLNMRSSYSLFSLFFTEEIFEKIANSTNAYAHLKRHVDDEKEFQGRSWKNTNAAEIKVFFATLIYMGVHNSSRLDLYWRNELNQGSIHTPQLYIAEKRFEQLKRYLHISDPRERNLNKKEWWYRVEPLASTFHKASREYYRPGSNLSIDEIMIQCFGRSLHTVKMPKKPIKQGYRVFALAEHGYIWTFSWSSRKQGIMEMFRYPSLTPTASMVMNMVESLSTISPTIPAAIPAAIPTSSQAAIPTPSSAAIPTPSSAAIPNPSSAAIPTPSSAAIPTAKYSIYMDNYFTSVPLFQLLRERGYGACGTTRPKSAKFASQLKELRQHYSKALPWGSLYAVVVDDVLCLAWQDNNLVLALSTIHSPTDFIERERKRPGEKSTNAEIVRKVFDDVPKKKLTIPSFIDDYNYNMGGVDIAQQHRAAYTTHLVSHRNWLPILYWLLDAAIVNAFRIQYIYMQQQEIKPLPTQLAFCEKLYMELFEFATLAAQQTEGLTQLRLNSQLNHQRISFEKRSVCIWCRYKRKQGQQQSIKHANQSNFGCSACGVALCTRTGCWEEFHSAEAIS